MYVCVTVYDDAPTSTRLVTVLPILDPSESFDRFYAQNYGRALGIAFALCGSRPAAEELAQDAFLAAFRKWDRVNRLDNPGAWLRRVMVNLSVSRFRRLVAEGKALLRLGQSTEFTLDADLDAAIDLWHEVRRLPRRQAQTVVLTYVDGLSRRDVAAVIGCSEETVKTHLERARHTLERRLRQQGDANGRR